MIDEFEKLISINNIFSAWQKFFSGKSAKKDIVNFWHNLEDNIFDLRAELLNKKYKHGLYEKFMVCDPKKRIIHKAKIRDRVVHLLVFNFLLEIFKKRFIFDSYASLKNKGNHKAVKRLKVFCRLVSKNNSQPCWILKCDVKKFFDNIDHEILFSFIKKQVKDKNILSLIWEIIDSFCILPGKGLPLGNMTSQLFANIYLHELDYFAKHILKLKHYIRFNDDFVIVSHDKEFLLRQSLKIQQFLLKELLLSLPCEKTFLRKLSWGIDFLGYIILPSGVLIRTKTRKRFVRKTEKKHKQYQLENISFSDFYKPLTSYLGTLTHCRSFELRQKIITNYLLYDIIL